jgi:hypothetical protein
MRPLLIQSRRDDPEQKIMFGDERRVRLPPGTFRRQSRDLCIR